MKKLLLATIAAATLMGAAAQAKTVEVFNNAAAVIAVELVNGMNHTISKDHNIPTGQSFKYDIPEFADPTKWRIKVSNPWAAFNHHIITKKVTDGTARDYHVIDGWNEGIWFR